MTLLSRLINCWLKFPDLVLGLGHGHAVTRHMMIFSARYSNEAASSASIGFIDPLISAALAPPPPKFENSTLLIERFIAFAIKRVNSVPAAPTTVPAMIIATFLLNETFEGDRETGERVVQRDYHFGMSAPPIGRAYFSTPNIIGRGKECNDDADVDVMRHRQP